MPKDISPSLLRTQSKVPSLFGKKGFVAAFTIFYTQASFIFWTRDCFPFNEVKLFPFNSISPKKKKRLLARLNGIQKYLYFRPCAVLLELEKELSCHYQIFFSWKKNFGRLNLDSIGLLLGIATHPFFIYLPFVTGTITRFGASRMRLELRRTRLWS